MGGKYIHWRDILNTREGCFGHFMPNLEEKNLHDLFLLNVNHVYLKNFPHKATEY